MKVALLGDIGLFGRFSLNNGLKPEEYFSDFIAATDTCDIIIGNLEVPFSRSFKEYAVKSASIGSNEQNIDILKVLNIDYVNLANNHIGDYGKNGYELTKKILTNNGIKYFGIENLVELIEHDNNKLCLSGFCNMDSNPVYLSGISGEGERGINIVDYDDILRTLKQADKAGYLNIMSFHSGLEHINLPGKADVCFARHLAEQFDYVLYGHHPHVVQAFEKYKKSHLFYSLGNFCFDDICFDNSKKPFVTMSERNKVGLVPILTIKNNEVINVEHIWTYLGESKMHLLSLKESQIAQEVSCIELLNLDVVEANRNTLLNEYFSSRKSQRNLLWYIKRLRLRYFTLLMNIKRNRKIYENKYLDKLKNKKII